VSAHYGELVSAHYGELVSAHYGELVSTHYGELVSAHYGHACMLSDVRIQQCSFTKAAYTSWPVGELYIPDSDHI
jgi:hypothetical protein